MNISIHNKANNIVSTLTSALRNGLGPADDKNVLNGLLDDLESCIDWISEKERQICIQLLSQSISAKYDPTLSVKFANLLKKLASGNALINNTTLGAEINWIVRSLYEAQIVNEDRIRCKEAAIASLEAILIRNIESIKDDACLIKLIPSIVRILGSFKNNELHLKPESQLSFINCIKCIIPLMNHADVRLIEDAVLCVTHDTESVPSTQALLFQIEVIQQLSEKSSSWLLDQIGTILGVALQYSSLGLPYYSHAVPQCLLPSPLACPENNATKNHCKVKNRRKQRKAAIEKAKKVKSIEVDECLPDMLAWSQTSESDFSDSEHGNITFFNKLKRTVRIAALSLLLYVAKCSGRKELLGYWNAILSGPYSITRLLQHDCSPRSILAASTVLMIMFNDGKLYLSQAQYLARSNSMLSYTSWSSLLADLITSVHVTLHEVLKNTRSNKALLSIIHCTSAVIRNTPYHRLKNSLLTNILSALYPHFTHNDYNVRTLALKCLSEIIVISPETDELLKLIQSNSWMHGTDVNCKLWIIKLCLPMLKNENLPTTVKVQCWNILSGLAKLHFSRLFERGPTEEVCEILLKHLSMADNILLQHAAARALEQFSEPIANAGDSCGVNIIELWLNLLEGPLIPMLQSTTGTVASVACDCVANITDGVFEKLSEKMRILVMTVLFGCVTHEDHLVRSAAVRTLGTIVVYPFLAQDIQIIYDVSERVIYALNGDNLNVKSKAAWALGNLSDVLLLGRERNIPIDEVPLITLLDISIKMGSDHERVKTCAMRAIGNMLRLVNDEHIAHEKVKNLVEKAAYVLVENAKTDINMKVRWNACYAMGNMLTNESLLFVPFHWPTKVFNALSELVVTCSNFKVRQAAASAIAIPKRRQIYGPTYVHLLVAVVNAFAKSQELPDFSEYKHQTNLIEQLFNTLCHLIVFLEKNDFRKISNLPVYDIEICVEHLQRFKENGVHLEKMKNVGTYISSQNIKLDGDNSKLNLVINFFYDLAAMS